MLARLLLFKVRGPLFPLPADSFLRGTFQPRRVAAHSLCPAVQIGHAHRLPLGNSASSSKPTLCGTWGYSLPLRIAAMMRGLRRPCITATTHKGFCIRRVGNQIFVYQSEAQRP